MIGNGLFCAKHKFDRRKDRPLGLDKIEKNAVRVFKNGSKVSWRRVIEKRLLQRFLKAELFNKIYLCKKCDLYSVLNIHILSSRKKKLSKMTK